jgi:hypothetical protein
MEAKTRELYDLNNDPGETKNLATEDPQRADALEKKLLAHFKSIGHDLTARTWETGFNPVYPSTIKPPKK